ncbi:hypothetical protein [Novosphingobium sp. KN65.2]|uniref:hypothetical protein n=1 Tax=Novosphingobium sp. KN65.2 TaxID=1478134 RepID=UPI0005E72AD4|nr:hypothetical protein [Novosphingobium sp. KN65.2]CDO36015.1 hypothetical protein SPHV1_2290031 [Novosphingobium sp. KN65.2]
MEIAEHMQVRVIALQSHTITNRKNARRHLGLTTSLLFDAAGSVEEWGRHDLANALRAIALDFDKGGERITSTKRRLPGQPSAFLARRCLKRVRAMGSFSK